MNYLRLSAPKKVSDWEGLYVISKRAMQNGFAEIPASSILLITSATTVKYMKTLPCKCCGISIKISVKATRSEFLEDFDFIKYQQDG